MNEVRVAMKSKRRVQFTAGLVGDTHHCEHVLDPVEDVGDLWWTSYELAEILRDCETFALMMESPKLSSSLLLSDDDCMRGLEAKTEVGAWERYQRHRDTSNAVLGTQEKVEKLRKQGTGETQGDFISMIAKECMAITRVAHILARDKGIDDQREAVRCRQQAPGALTSIVDTAIFHQYVGKRCESKGIDFATESHLPEVTMHWIELRDLDNNTPTPIMDIDECQQETVECCVLRLGADCNSEPSSPSPSVASSKSSTKGKTKKETKCTTETKIKKPKSSTSSITLCPLTATETTKAKTTLTANLSIGKEIRRTKSLSLEAAMDKNSSPVKTRAGASIASDTELKRTKSAPLQSTMDKTSSPVKKSADSSSITSSASDTVPKRGKRKSLKYLIGKNPSPVKTTTGTTKASRTTSSIASDTEPKQTKSQSLKMTIDKKSSADSRSISSIASDAVPKRTKSPSLKTTIDKKSSRVKTTSKSCSISSIACDIVEPKRAKSKSLKDSIDKISSPVKTTTASTKALRSTSIDTEPKRNKGVSPRKKEIETESSPLPTPIEIQEDVQPDLLEKVKHSPRKKQNQTVSLLLVRELLLPIPSLSSGKTSPPPPPKRNTSDLTMETVNSDCFSSSVEDWDFDSDHLVFSSSSSSLIVSRSVVVSGDGDTGTALTGFFDRFRSRTEEATKRTVNRYDGQRRG